MFSLTIVFGPGPMVWTLMYKTEEAAAAATKKMMEEGERAEMMTLFDDFGQNAAIIRGAVHGVMFEDMELSKLAHIERALHQTRVKVKADEMARVDPAIRAAMMQGGGSAILQPAMPANGGWRG